jgi:hypothetical protein
VRVREWARAREREWARTRASERVWACECERARAHIQGRRSANERFRFFLPSLLARRSRRAVHIVDTVIIPTLPKPGGSASIALSLACALAALVAAALTL